MDAFTASAAQITEDQTSQKSRHPLRPIFFLLLIATLLSATATTYILVTGNIPQLVPQEEPLPQTTTENPFLPGAAEAASNPFSEENAQVDISQAFSEEAPVNFFDQFTTEEAGSSGEYQNPF